MPTIAAQRLLNQRLAASRLSTPGEVVAWFGAVQAQEYVPSRWALGLRMEKATGDQIEQALSEGSILRTHALRPTWHFVTPADIRWVLSLTAPRVKALLARTYRELELDETLLTRSMPAIAAALAGGNYLTRAEIGPVLARAGIVAAGQRLSLIMHRAEIEGVVCSGPRRGKQFTYALLDERAPRARTLPRDEALAELCRRYFTSHGPATMQDFAWWSGLTVADGRAGLEMNKPGLVPDAVAGKTYFRPAASPPAAADAPLAHLLPPFDEYVVAYRDRGAILDPALAAQVRTDLLASSIVVDGQLLGMWKGAASDGVTVVEVAPFRPLRGSESEALAEAVRRWGRFHGQPVELAVTDGTAAAG